MDITVALQTAIDSVQKLRALVKKIEDAEIRMLLADLSNELADAKLEAANIKIELATARNEIAKLKGELTSTQFISDALAEALPEVVEGNYVFPGQSGSFCTACYDSKRQKIRLAKLTGPFAKLGTWKCPVCTAIF